MPAMSAFWVSRRALKSAGISELPVEQLHVEIELQRVGIAAQGPLCTAKTEGES